MWFRIRPQAFRGLKGNLRDFELLFAPIQNMGVDHRRTQMYPNPWKDYNYKSFPGRLLVVICTTVERWEQKETSTPCGMPRLIRTTEMA